MVRALLGKILNILQNLKILTFTLFSNRYYSWFLTSKVLDNLIIILKSLNLSTIETLSFLKSKNSMKTDKELLNMIIKKNAHFVEKDLFFPRDNIKEKSNKGIINLKKGIKEWDDKNYENSEPIKWAKQILLNYQDHYPNNCPNCRIKEKTVENQVVSPEDLLDLIKRRRSRRFYSDKPLSEKDKKLLVEAAIHAPSTCNSQAIRLLLIGKANLKKYISKFIKGGSIFFGNAPVIIILLADKRGYRHPGNRYNPYLDTAAAIQNILLMAEAMGLACCWGNFSSNTADINESKLRKTFNIPDIYIITGSIAIGHKSNEVLYVPRDKPETMYSEDKFLKDKKL